MAGLPSWDARDNRCTGEPSTLPPQRGHLVTTIALQIPESGKIYAFNEGNYQGWTPELREYIDSLKDAEKWGGKPYSSRWDFWAMPAAVPSCSRLQASCESSSD